MIRALSPRVEALLVAAMLAVHTALLAWNAHCHSPVATEIGHLPAGISHWRFLRFDLYRVNPPLVRMVAALPVMLADPETDWSSYNTNPVVRAETFVGMGFVKANGERTFWLYTLGRWACIPFSWIGAWVCYRWARELFGVAAGLTALALWCFCPNVLGHGALMMPDVPSAALGVAACYVFRRWLRSSTWQGALIAGVVLGLAELTKTTLLVFYPLWPLLWIGYRLGQISEPRGEGDRHVLLCKTSQSPGRGWLREAGMLATMIVLSVYVINMGYVFEGTCQRLGEYRFKSRVLSGMLGEGRSFVVGNRFAETWLASLPVPLPMNYVQGIDAQKIDFERGMRSYLGGEFRDRGWCHFYLYGMAIKIPLGMWVLIALATGMAVMPRWRTVAWRDELLLLAPLVAILVLVSSQTGFSIHFRYVLPVFPFLFIWASRSAVWLTSSSWLARVAVAVALDWSITSSLWHYPHSLSYFNELVGGPRRGHEHLLDSNISWGQDLLHLKKWYDANPGARPLHVAMYSLVNPKLAGIDWRPVQPSDITPGWYVIDVNMLQGSFHPMMDTAGQLRSVSRNELTQFQQFEPVARIGYSLYVYHITPESVETARAERGALPYLAK